MTLEDERKSMKSEVCVRVYVLSRSLSRARSLSPALSLSLALSHSVSRALSAVPLISHDVDARVASKIVLVLEKAGYFTTCR